MNSKTIAMLVGAVLLGMLLANMLKNDGGCKTVEGYPPAGCRASEDFRRELNNEEKYKDKPLHNVCNDATTRDLCFASAHLCEWCVGHSRDNDLQCERGFLFPYRGANYECNTYNEGNDYNDDEGTIKIISQETANRGGEDPRVEEVTVRSDDVCKFYGKKIGPHAGLPGIPINSGVLGATQSARDTTANTNAVPEN